MPKFYEIWMINIFTINQELCYNKKKKKKTNYDWDELCFYPFSLLFLKKI